MPLDADILYAIETIISEHGVVVNLEDIVLYDDFANLQGENGETFMVCTIEDVVTISVYTKKIQSVVISKLDNLTNYLK